MMDLKCVKVQETVGQPCMRNTRTSDGKMEKMNGRSTKKKKKKEKGGRKKNQWNLNAGQKIQRVCK